MKSLKETKRARKKIMKMRRMMQTVTLTWIQMMVVEAKMMKSPRRGPSQRKILVSCRRRLKKLKRILKA